MILPPSGLTRVPAVAPLINVGACRDIPSGSFKMGRYGEYILNGGMGPFNGTTGPGNTFKTEIIEFDQRQLLRRFPKSISMPYDSESNKDPNRGNSLWKEDPNWDGTDLLDDDRWQVSSVVQHLGCEWFDKTKDWLTQHKIDPKNRKGLMVSTPMLNQNQDAFIQIPIPTGGTIDSMSAFRTRDVVKMQDDNQLGDAKANTIWMRQGAQKKRLIEELPALLMASGHYLGSTAHLGEKIKIDMYAPDVVVLQHLKNGVLKGVPRDYSYLTHTLYHVFSSRVASTRDRTPQWPRDPVEDKMVDSTDLNEVTVRMLRNKFGPSGFTVKLLISQEEGLLDYLTEFVYLKERKEGFQGNDRRYQLILRPDVTLQRTTVRRQLFEDALLRRAMNISTELTQIREFYPDARNYWMPHDELFAKITELGYNWDQLLQTRGWWTYDNDKHPIPFLSSRDLLEMAHKRYVPYWMKKEDIPSAVQHVERVKLF